jgi:hypothetical protein
MRFGLLPPAQSPALDKARSAPFRKADVDDIEVPRHHRLREDGACFAGYLGPEVAVREMGEDEHLHPRGARELGRPGGRRVQRVPRALALLEREGRLMDEHVRLPGGGKDRRRRTRIAGERDLPPRARRAEHLLRRGDPAAP